MKHSPPNWRRRPQKLCSPFQRSENLTVVPASELETLREWKSRARRLAPGDTLMVVPRDNLKMYEIAMRIHTGLQGHRRHFTVIFSDSRS